MKKTIFLAIICIALLSVFGISVSASSLNSGDADRETLSSQLSSEQLALIQNSDLYNDSMNGITVEGQPVVIVYNRMFWEYAELSLDDIVNKATKSIPPDYLLFETSTRIQTLQKEDGQMSILVRETYTQDTLPTYLQDIASSDGKSCTILGKSQTIANVICFDGTASHQGIAVYYVTDNNETYVRYYDSRTAKAAEFTLTDFQEYGVAYHNYITSDEFNYTEKGEPLGGATVPFTEFIHSDKWTAYLNPSNKPIAEKEPVFATGTVITVAAVLLSAIVALLFILRKKKAAQKAS